MAEGATRSKKASEEKTLLRRRSFCLGLGITNAIAEALAEWRCDLCVSGGCNVFPNLLLQLWPGGEPSAERLEKIIVTLPCLCARGGLRSVGELWRRSQPESDEHGGHFDRNTEVSLNSLDTAVDAVQPLGGCRFAALVGIGRQEGGDGGLGNEGAGLVAPRSEVCERTHQIRIEVN